MAPTTRVGRLQSAVRRRHGEPATYVPQGGSPIDLLVVPSTRAREVFLDSSVVRTVRATFELVRDDVPGGPKKRDRLTYAGVEFEVSDVEGPNSEGFCVLVAKAV